MEDMATFSQQISEVKEKINNLSDDIDPEIIEETALRLEGLNYTPSVITANNLFVRMTTKGLLDEVERILAMPEEEACALAPDNTKKCEDLRLGYIKVIIFYYEKLILLRQGDAEEWDEIDELYVHD